MLSSGWFDAGTAIRICMVGFAGPDVIDKPLLDGQAVTEIHADLSSGIDVTGKKYLQSNQKLCFMGTTKVGDFDIPHEVAVAMLDGVNPHGKPNSDVLRPFRNGSDLVQDDSNRWIVDFGVARGGALVDLDLDGRLDLVQVLRHDDARIWHNTGPADASPEATHWLGVDLDQDGPNHDAIGAWVAVRNGERILTEREVTVGGGHASGTHGPLHIGLGPATTPEVRVTWPDGDVGPWQPVEPDGYVTIRRGSTEVDRWGP